MHSASSFQSSFHFETNDGFSYEFIQKCKDNQKVDCLTQGLRGIGLIGSNEIIRIYRDIGGWVRGGAETYIAVAEMTTTERKIKCIAKAIISFGSTPSQRLSEMNLRREELKNFGIRVPHKFTEHKGTIYEEYIDKDLLSNKLELTKNAKREIAETAAVLDSLGYKPSNFLHDMRCDQGANEVYYVDFGFDLGNGGVTPQNECLQQLEREFRAPDYELMVIDYRRRFAQMLNPYKQQKHE